MRKQFFLFSLFLFVALLPGSLWAQKGTIKVAVQAPLSGEQAALGEHVKLGAQLAVEEATKAFKALGFDLVFVPYDDQAKPEVGVANARNIVADPDVLVPGSQMPLKVPIRFEREDVIAYIRSVKAATQGK